MRPAPPDRPLPGLTADPVRLRQAVGNLVSNAVRHTPSGGKVTLRPYGSETGGAVLVDVTDTGSGIPPEDLGHVFDRFWRGEKSRSRRTGGSGLGLAIVRKLAEAHDGTVTAVSVPGQGSVFTLRLPADPEGSSGDGSTEAGSTEGGSTAVGSTAVGSTDDLSDKDRDGSAHDRSADGRSASRDLDSSGRGSEQP